MVGELLQAAATNVLHAAAGPQDLRVERTYAVKTKNGPPRKVRLVANLYTEQAIQLLEGVPVSDNNQVKTPQGDLLHLHGPDRTRAEAHLITNVPSGIKLESIIDHVKAKWDLDTLSLGYAPPEGILSYSMPIRCSMSSTAPDSPNTFSSMTCLVLQLTVACLSDVLPSRRRRHPPELRMRIHPHLVHRLFALSGYQTPVSTAFYG